MTDKCFDLICVGRSCVDMYSEEFGVPLERAMIFSKSVGGSPMNIAIGSSRLGLHVGAITGVGKEANGDYLKWQLSCEGVDVSNVKTDPTRLTAVVFLSIRGKDDFPLIQYRENCADMGLSPEDIDPDYIAQAKAVLVTGIHLSREGVRAATMKVLESAKKFGLKCILDIDFRPNLWGLQGHDAGSSRWAEASERVTSEYRKVLPYFDLIVGTEEEYFIASGKTETFAALREVRRLTNAILVHKLGDRGCVALDGAIPDAFTDDIVQSGFPVKVFNSIGAGDGFMSGFLRGWLRGEDLPTSCRYANAVGAFAVSRLGCSSAYPSWEELQYFLEHGSKESWLRHDTILEQIHWATNRRVIWKNLAVFAFDHRLVFETLMKKYDKTTEEIRAFKKLVYNAVLKVCYDASVRNSIGILVDDAYSLDILLNSNKHPLWVGRSIEMPGVSPLAFEGEADVGMTIQSWPENHVVKCLFHPDDGDVSSVEENRKQLCRLGSAVRGTGHELLLELLPESVDRDASLIHWMRTCYELGVYPDYWKMLPLRDTSSWKKVEALIDEFDPYCRGILILGNNASQKELEESFMSIPRNGRVIGFAIGRSLFLQQAERWFAGKCNDDEAVESMRANFLQLIRGWNRWFFYEARV